MSVWLECRLEKEVVHMKRALIAVFGAAIVAVLAGVGSAQMGGSMDPGMMGPGMMRMMEMMGEGGAGGMGRMGPQMMQQMMRGMGGGAAGQPQSPTQMAGSPPNLTRGDTQGAVTVSAPARSALSGPRARRVTPSTFSSACAKRPAAKA